MGSLYRPQELRACLDRLGVRPNKKLGQHFLIDGNILGKILAAAKLTASDQVLEVGPGPGALTESLVESGASVTAVEIDKNYASHLKELLPSLNLIEGDVLTTPLPKSTNKVVANVPYFITSAIIERLIVELPNLESMTLMMQSEVADRILAKPGAKEYGTLTLQAAYFGEAKRLFLVKPGCFYPKPSCDSVVIQITKEGNRSDPAPFFRFIKELFSHRRKIVKSTLLKMGIEAPVEISHKRVEELSLHDLLLLFT
jgi:16S rRNA (adenine1518-N6/adenine1519-N6)-dimethyltransferase